LRRRFFQWLSVVTKTRKGALVVLLALAFLASVYWLASGHLKINSSRNGMVSNDDPEQALFMAYNKQFGAANDIVVILEGDSRQALRDSADKVAKQFWKIDGVSTVFYRVDLDALADNGLYYLSTQNLTRLAANLDMLEKLTRSHKKTDKVVLKGIPKLVSDLNEGIEKFTDGEVQGLGQAKLTESDIDASVTAISSLIDELTNWLIEPDRKYLGLRASFAKRESGLDLDNEGYLSANSGKMLLMRINSHRDVVDVIHAAPLISGMESALEENLSSGIEWSIAGVPGLIAEEQATLQRELPLSGIVSLIGCLLLFALAYRSLLSTAVVMLPLLVGLTWTLALTAVLIGSLNLLTSPMAIIIIGMGIDFSVHLFTRAREEQRAGKSASEATHIALVSTGPPVMTGGLTSAAAFGAMIFTDFQGTSEMGIIGCTGLILVMLASFTMMPMLLRFPRSVRFSKTVGSNAAPWDWPHQKSKMILGVGIVITLALGLCIRPIDFNYDQDAFVSEGSKARAAIDKLKASGVGGAEYAVTRSNSMKESRTQHTELLKLTGENGVVDRLESIFDVLPPDLEAKEVIVSKIRKFAGKLPRVHFEARPESDLSTLGPALKELSENAKTWLPAYLRTLGEKELAARVGQIVPALTRLQGAMSKLNKEELRTRLNHFEVRIADLSKRFDAFFRRADRPLQPSDLPASLVAPYYVMDGDKAVYAVRIYPRGDISDPQYNRNLRDTVRKVDPKATGYALVYVYFGVIMKNGLKDAALWAGIVVLLLLILDLRSLKYVTLAAIPLVFGVFWMVGLMNVFKIDYTYSNMISIPLILGIGIDSGLHVIHRWRECGEVGESIRSTGRAILISTLTTMTAFGAMMMGSHRGVNTLAVTLVLGLSSCLILTLVFLPALLDLLQKPRSEEATPTE